jgi:hypothetical protein
MAKLGGHMDLPDIDSLWDYRDPAASERAFQQALPLARNTGNAEYLAQLLTQLARSQVLQRRYQQATVTLDPDEENSGCPRAIFVGARTSVERYGSIGGCAGSVPVGVPAGT